MRNVILVGDALEQLKTLPAESVHCCITSPPYYGLRDYGTALWDGGAEDCDHIQKRTIASSTLRNDGRKNIGTQPTDKAALTVIPFHEHCGKCGARRIDSQLGLEATPEEYIANMVAVFREVRRVLRRDGTLWLNMGDGYSSGDAGRTKAGFNERYFGKQFATNQQAESAATVPHRERPAGLKPKDLLGMPWRLAFALQNDGWWLRSDIIWSKPNPMPESVTDRPTKAHEYLFLLAKSKDYYYDAEAIREKAEYGRREWSNVDGNLAGLGVNGSRGHATVSGADPSAGRNKRSVWEIPSEHMENTPRNDGARWRQVDGGVAARGKANKRSVWEVATQAYKEAHFATFPEELVKPCVQAGTSEWGCCADCGAPWVRQTELTEEYSTLLASGKAWRDDTGKPDSFTNRQPSDHPANVPQKYKTIGWQPSCAHLGGSIIPGIILDPFLGAGTTALVALKAGRDFIGIELSPAYAAMAERRIAPYRSRLL